MGRLWFRYRIALRENWRGWSVLALVCGIAAALPLAVTADARRTDSALPRLLSARRAANIEVSGNISAVGAEASAQFLDDVDALPEVDAAARMDGLWVARVLPDGSIDQRLNVGSAVAKVVTDVEALRHVGGFRLLAGREITADHADEVMVSPEFLASTGRSVGDTMDDLRVYGLEGLNDDFETEAPNGIPTHLTIVGEVLLTLDYIDESGERIPQMYMTPAFGATFPQTPVYTNDFLRLRGGNADVDPFITRVRGIASKASIDDPLITDLRAGLAASQESLRPQVIATYTLAVVLAGAAAVILAQVISRRLATAVRSEATLSALGATRRALFLDRLLHGASIALGAGVIAPLLAAATTVVTPLGSTHRVEPHPGFRFDAVLFVLGGIATFLALTAWAAVPAWRSARAAARPPTSAVQRERVDRPLRLGGVLASGGFTPVQVTGIRFAIQAGRGEAATPVRGVIASIAVAIAVLTAGVMFHHDFNRLIDEPALHGMGWDLSVQNTIGSLPPDALDPLLARPEVGSAAGYTVGVVDVDGRSVRAVGIDQLEGDHIFPTLDGGTSADRSDQIVLGARTLHDIGRHIGDTVHVTTPAGMKDMRIVGVATFPAIGTIRYAETSLGHGAAMTVENLPAPADEFGGEYSGLLIRLAPDAPPEAESTLRQFVADIGCADDTCFFTDRLPHALSGYTRINELTVPFAITLELMFAISLGHGIVSAVSFRRRELAILGALGISRSQARRVVVYQSITLALFALGLGLSFGALAGNALWRVFCDRIGTATPAAWPWNRLGLIAAGTVAFALVVALVAGPAVDRRRSVAELTRA